jgi:hypothetical protein
MITYFTVAHISNDFDISITKVFEWMLLYIQFFGRLSIKYLSKWGLYGVGNTFLLDVFFAWIIYLMEKSTSYIRKLLNNLCVVRNVNYEDLS